jgi:hypothetical protein
MLLCLSYNVSEPAWQFTSITVFFCRAEVGARCHTGDLVVDRPSHQICLFVRKSKGDQRRDTSDKLVIAIPIAANPVLADLLDYYTQHRIAFCPKFYNRPPPAAFLSFSPAEPSAAWGAASTATPRPASPPTRGQHRGGRRLNQANIPVARHDDRTTAPMVPARHQ